MKITQVKVRHINKDKLKAMANVTLEDSLVLTGIKVLEGGKGLFVSMPSNKGRDGDLDENGRQKYYDIFYPITKEFRETLVGAVMQEFAKGTDVDGFIEADDPDSLPF